MFIEEVADGRVKLGDKEFSIQEMTSKLNEVFVLNQIFIKRLDSTTHTLWFNSDSFVFAELVPVDVRGMVKKQYGIS